MIRHIFHFVVYSAKQINDKVICGHELSLRNKSIFSQILITLAFAHDLRKSTSTNG